MEGWEWEKSEVLGGPLVRELKLSHAGKNHTPSLGW